MLQQKEAIRILCDEERRGPDPRERDVKRVRGGLLVQDARPLEERREHDGGGDRAPAERGAVERHAVRLDGLPHVRSNAIVIAKDGATLGIGAGQMSRVDSVRLAVEKCRDARRARPSPLAGSAVASDAFFPFADGPPARDRGRRHVGDPARRLEARRRGDRGLRRRRRRDGLHRTATSGTSSALLRELSGCPQGHFRTAAIRSAHFIGPALLPRRVVAAGLRVRQ